MKLIFAVFYVSSTIGLTRYYKTEDFLHLYKFKSLQMWFVIAYRTIINFLFFDVLERWLYDYKTE